MSWLTENWIWVLFGVAFIAMHLFGHGGHGGHGSSPGDGNPNNTAAKQAGGIKPTSEGGGHEPHRH
jgi:hypothetical protein